MRFFWRTTPCLRAPFGAGLLALVSAAAAQALPAMEAADPGSPVASPTLVLPPGGTATIPALPDDLAAARAVWQRANERVAEFPRGHADLLRWESSQPKEAAPDDASQGPALGFAQALRLSLRHRPELFTHADMNPLARAQVQTAYAAHVREVRSAWIEAIATRQRDRLLGEILDATRTGSELGRRMVVAGNWSQARQMREQVIEADAWQASMQAHEASLSARERLASLLGLWQAQAVSQLGTRLPDSLPEPPAQVSQDDGAAEAGFEAAVLRNHPLLAQARLLATRDATAPTAARRQAWNSAVGAALDALPDPGTAMVPPHIDHLGLLRDPTLARAVSSEAGLLQQAIERRAMARQAWTALRVRHASALHAQNVLAPLQAALQQETQLRYNGMLQGTWELLASARERMAALDTAQQARQSYWLAEADWQSLLAGADIARPGTANTPTAAKAPNAGH